MLWSGTLASPHSTPRIRTLVPEEVFSENGRVSAKLRDWEASVYRKIVKGKDWAKSLFSDTKTSDKNGSYISITESVSGTLAWTGF